MSSLVALNNLSGTTNSSVSNELLHGSLFKTIAAKSMQMRLCIQFRKTKARFHITVRTKINKF